MQPHAATNTAGACNLILNNKSALEKPDKIIPRKLARVFHPGFRAACTTERSADLREDFADCWRVFASFENEIRDDFDCFCFRFSPNNSLMLLKQSFVFGGNSSEIYGQLCNMLCEKWKISYHDHLLEITGLKIKPETELRKNFVSTVLHNSAVVKAFESQRCGSRVQIPDMLLKFFQEFLRETCKLYCFASYDIKINHYTG